MKQSKAYKIFSKIDITIAMIAFAVLVIVTFFGVLSRYILNNPFIWQEELQLSLILWIVFLGGSYAFRQKGHIVIDLVVEMFPERLKKITRIFIYVITMLVLFYVFLNSGNLTAQYAATGKILSSLRISMVYVYIAVPLGLALMMISLTLDFIDEILEEKKAKKEAEK